MTHVQKAYRTYRRVPEGSDVCVVWCYVMEETGEKGGKHWPFGRAITTLPHAYAGNRTVTGMLMKGVAVIAAFLRRLAERGRPFISWWHVMCILAQLATASGQAGLVLRPREWTVLLRWRIYVKALCRRWSLPDVMDYLLKRSVTICGKVTIPSVRVALTKAAK